MQATEEKYKRCPYCAEEILAEALKCKHCGEFLKTHKKKNLFFEDETEAPEHKKSFLGGCVKNIFIVLAALLVALILLTYVFEGNPSQNSDQIFNVEYHITGSASEVDLTITVPGGGTEMHQVKIPFTKIYKFRRLEHAYISAQNLSESGSVETTIYVDGSKIKSARSTGAYSIASVDLLVGYSD